jgi:hypothetical protein
MTPFTAKSILFGPQMPQISADSWNVAPIQLPETVRELVTLVAPGSAGGFEQLANRWSIASC